MNVSLFLSLLLILAQPPSKTTQPPNHLPPHHQWHQFHGQRLSFLQTQYSVPFVVVQSPDTVYVTVDSAGNVVQSYRLIPVVASAPVVVTPPVVIEQPHYRGWFRWRR